MYSINETFRTFGPEYIQSFGASMPNAHRKVIDAIIECRTQACGMVVYECAKCGIPHMTFRSCGNRHCPKCQNHKIKVWVEKQMKRQLPGFFRVLHTWGRQLQYHPHIHYIVPGGAILREDGSWHPSRIDFYLPVRAMSKIFRAKFYEEMKKAGLLLKISAHIRTIDWNVNCQAIGSSERSIKYLAPYVFKVAISDNRIVKVDGRDIFIRYKKTGSERRRTMKLDVMEFIRRFLQHVLPTGFMKVRYYGFLSPSSSISMDHIRKLLEKAYDIKFMEPEPSTETTSGIICPHCGGELKYSYSILPFQMIPMDTG